MKSLVKKLLIKFKFNSQLNSDENKLYCDIGRTTIMKGGVKMIFRVDKENRNYLRIGEKGIIDSKFFFESPKGKVSIGNNVHIGGANFISRESITVGNDVTMAWDITIYDHNSHSVNWVERKNDNKQCYEDYLNHKGNNILNKDWTHVIAKPIIIEDKVWIGFGATILKGVTIGEGAVVGAKSVVTKNVLPWTVVAGNPASIVKEIPENYRG